MSVMVLLSRYIRQRLTALLAVSRESIISHQSPAIRSRKRDDADKIQFDSAGSRTKPPGESGRKCRNDDGSEAEAGKANRGRALSYRQGVEGPNQTHGACCANEYGSAPNVW